MTPAISHDPELDLILERTVDVPPELVWKAWTTPEQMKKWFTPAPWTTEQVELDLRPGGIFRTVMRSPEGQLHPNVACCLEAVAPERFVWTTVLLPGFRPVNSTEEEALDFTAIIAMAPDKAGTRYTAHVMHRTPAACRKHAEMGFHDGWGTALDQLVALARTWR